VQKQQLVRFVGAGIAFAFAVEWVAQGFEAAVFCLLAAGLGFAAVVAVQRSSLTLPRLDPSALKERTRASVRARVPSAPPRPQRRPARVVVEPVSGENTRYGW
jgi:hypothetical protein